MSAIGFGSKIAKENFDVERYAEAAEWCVGRRATIADKGDYFEVIAIPQPQVTLADYDFAVESHLKAERIARGYTEREPSDYAGSSVARWAQDAADWIAHRDAVMVYALEVLNAVKAGGEAPSLDDFKAALPKIAWTAQDGEAE